MLASLVSACHANTIHLNVGSRFFNFENFENLQTNECNQTSTCAHGISFRIQIPTCQSSCKIKRP